MLSSNGEYKSTRNGNVHWDVQSMAENEYSHTDSPTRFHGKFTDCMEMSAPAPTVANYLDAHQGWFCRCAQPMRVEQLQENAYALTIGRFGSFGYEVEPKVGLELLPPDQGIYRIKTVPVPNYVAPGYDVDFQAMMELVEAPSLKENSHPITRVEWNLDLAVVVQFPKFIQRLPKSLVQNTGDRLLHRIVKQVSRRLTHKVQQDFHQSLGLTVPFQSKPE